MWIMIENVNNNTPLNPEIHNMHPSAPESKLFTTIPQWKIYVREIWNFFPSRQRIICNVYIEYEEKQGVFEQTNATLENGNILQPLMVINSIIYGFSSQQQSIHNVEGRKTEIGLL